jgi:hypothetical protein
MTPVVITISHALGKEEVLRRLRPALGQAAHTFPVIKVEQEVWSGDRMDFRVRSLGQAITGNVQVLDDSVRLEVSLPWLLAKFANALQRTIAQKGRILLEKK